MISFAENKKASEYSPLALAYIGDSVYEIYVRARVLAENPDKPAHKLHVEAVKYVKAHAQSNSMEKVAEMLDEEETAVYKRGRNAKAATVPKNAVLADYRRATGFEALVGYLFILQRYERLELIMQTAYESARDNSR